MAISKSKIVALTCSFAALSAVAMLFQNFDAPFNAVRSDTRVQLTKGRSQHNFTYPGNQSRFGGNGFATTWDGRVFILTNNVQLPPPTLAPIGTIDSNFSINPGQEKQIGNLIFRIEEMTGGSTATIRSASSNELLWQSNFAKNPDGSLLSCGGDCLFAYVGSVLRLTHRVTGTTLWRSGFVPSGQNLNVYSVKPYLSITKQDGSYTWSAMSPVGWVVRAFRPEQMGNQSYNDVNGVKTEFNKAFSDSKLWAFPEKDIPAEVGPPAQRIRGSSTPFNGTNVLAIVPDPTFTVNPYSSNAEGVAREGNEYWTYQVKVITQDYAGDGRTSMQMMPATFIVKDPLSKNGGATIEKSYSSTGIMQPLISSTGLIYGIEPSVTFDGKLMVYQRFDNHPTDHSSIYYSFNPNGPVANGWETPKRITEMVNDRRLQLLYPMARYPMRFGDGSLATGKVLKGAYPWVSLDGTDMFFSALRAQDGALRAGTAIVGASSKGLLRLVDGAVNLSRRGPGTRVTMGSFGRSPGMWSPFEFTKSRPLPLTDKQATYLMVLANGSQYFESSYEETVQGGYDLFYEMSEGLGENIQLLLGQVPDVSGKNFVASKNGGVHWLEELNPTTCRPELCPENDPESPSSKLFSGKALYFAENGLMTTPATSASGHRLMRDAQGITLSMAIRPLKDFSTSSTNEFRFLARQNGAMSLILERNRQLHLRLAIKDPVTGVISTLSSGFVGEPLPMNEWSHIAFTYEPRMAILKLYQNGKLISNTKHSQFRYQQLHFLDTPFYLGDGQRVQSEIIYGLDQVGLARVVRTPDEIRRQANLIYPKINQTIGTDSPRFLGLTPASFRSEVYRQRQPSDKLVDLGRHLFFDPRLSRDNSVSCASCHQPGKSYGDARDLAPSRLAVLGGPQRLLRNAPSVMNMALTERFFHDGRASNLAEQAQAVLFNPEEMGNSAESALNKLKASPQYQELFKTAYPRNADPINMQNIRVALTEFQLTLVGGNSRVDQFALDMSKLGFEEQQGRALFYGKARCAECHSGPSFSNGAFHRLAFVPEKNRDGREDIGRAASTKTNEDRFKFKTPSLRFLQNTGPYFHAGSVDSLEGLVALYAAGVNEETPISSLDDSLTQISLSDRNQRHLVAYLKALESEAPSVATPTFQEKITALPTQLSYETATEILRSGQKLEMSHGQLEMDARGAVSFRRENGQVVELISGNSSCASSCRLRFTSDKRLVVDRGTDTSPVGQTFATPVPARDRTHKLLITAYEPYLRLVDANDSILWFAGSRFDSLSLPTGRFILFGVNQELMLVMQGDGNLVIYKYTTPNSRIALWATGTAGRSCGPGCRTKFQLDGNLVLYDANSSSYWSTKTHGRGTALVLSPTAPHLRVEENGNVIWQ